MPGAKLPSDTACSTDEEISLAVVPLIAYCVATYSIMYQYINIVKGER